MQQCFWQNALQLNWLRLQDLNDSLLQNQILNGNKIIYCRKRRSSRQFQSKFLTVSKPRFNAQMQNVSISDRFVLACANSKKAQELTLRFGLLVFLLDRGV